MAAKKSIGSVAFGKLLDAQRITLRMSREEVRQVLSQRHAKLGMDNLAKHFDGRQVPTMANAAHLFMVLGQDLDWCRFQRLVASLQLMAPAFDMAGAVDGQDNLHSFLKGADPEVYELIAMSNIDETQLDMLAFLKRRSTRTSNDTVYNDLALNELPPVYRDLIESTITQLGEFPPHVSPKAMEDWEVRNSGRITKVTGFVTSPLLLLSEGFSWSYLQQGGKSANLNLFFPTSEAERDTVEKQVTDTVARLKTKFQSLRTERITTRFIYWDWELECLNRLLRFDLVRRSGASRTNAGDSASSGEIEFNNMWVFSLRSHIEKKYPSTFPNKVDVAFLDGADVAEPKSAAPRYAVSTSKSHADSGLLFADGLSKVSVKSVTQTANPSRKWWSNDIAFIGVSLENVDKYISKLAETRLYFLECTGLKKIQYVLGDHYFQNSRTQVLGHPEKDAIGEMKKRVALFEGALKDHGISEKPLLASEIRSDDIFLETLKSVRKACSTTPRTLQLVSADAKRYVDSLETRKVKITNRKQSEEASRLYILDELAFYSTLVERGLSVELYPGSEISSIKAAIHGEILTTETKLADKVTVHYEVKL